MSEHHWRTRRGILALGGAGIASALGAVTAPAQGPIQPYPVRPVKVIVPVAAGGANDTTARLFAQRLAELLGQQFYVENVAGAGGNLGIGAAARAAPDGYTLLAAGGNFVINPSLYAKVPYDPVKDFSAISLMCSSPHFLAVHPSVPARTVARAGRARQGEPRQLELRLGRPRHARASGRRVAQARLRHRLTHVPFTGGGPAMTATIGGHVPVDRLGAADRIALRAGGQCARARDDERRALLAAARRADHGGGDRHRARGRHRHRAGGAGRARRARSSISCTTQSRKSSRRRSSSSVSPRSASIRSPARPPHSRSGSRTRSPNGAR